MQIFVAVITLFPVAVAILLRSKYLWLVLSLAAANLLGYMLAYQNLWTPYQRCSADIHNYCGGNGQHYLIILTANIILAVIIWYLAFVHNPQPDELRGPITASQMSSGQYKQKMVRKLLSGMGLLIVVGVILIIVGFMVALSAM
jgi:hypothetical protein